MKNKKGNEKTAINGKRFLIVLISALIAVALCVTCALVVDTSKPVDVANGAGGEAATSTSYSNLTGSLAGRISNGDTVTYSGGTSYTVTLPIGTYDVEAYGGAGGGANAKSTGGLGAKVTGRLSVTTPTTFYFYVGGAGRNGGTSGGAGGFNGGASGGVGRKSNSGGGGGGATDIRRGGTAVGNRILVAGGGGGAGGAGQGGASNGTISTNTGGAGGYGGAGAGSAGANGAASCSTNANGNGGGGGKTNGGGSGGGTNNGATSSNDGTYYPAGGGGGGGGYYGGGGGGGGSRYGNNSNVRGSSGGSGGLGSGGSGGAGASTARAYYSGAGGGGGGGSSYYGGVSNGAWTANNNSGAGRLILRVINVNLPPVSVANKSFNVGARRATGANTVIKANEVATEQANDPNSSGTALYFTNGTAGNLDAVTMSATNGLWYTSACTTAVSASKYFTWRWDNSGQMTITGVKMYPRAGYDGVTTNGTITLYTKVRDNYGGSSGTAQRGWAVVSFKVTVSDASPQKVTTTLNSTDTNQFNDVYVGTSKAGATAATASASNIYNPNGGGRYTALLARPLRLSAGDGSDVSVKIPAASLLSGVNSYDQVLIALKDVSGINKANSARIFAVTEHDAGSVTSSYNSSGTQVPYTYTSVTIKGVNSNPNYQVYTVALYVVEKSSVRGANYQHPAIAAIDLDIVFKVDNSRPTLNVKSTTEAIASASVTLQAGEVLPIHLKEYFVDQDNPVQANGSGGISNTTHRITGVKVPTSEFIALDKYGKVVPVETASGKKSYYNLYTGPAPKVANLKSALVTGELDIPKGSSFGSQTDLYPTGFESWYISNTASSNAFIQYSFSGDTLTLTALRATSSMYKTGRTSYSAIVSGGGNGITTDTIADIGSSNIKADSAANAGDFYILIHVQDYNDVDDTGIWLPLAITVNNARPTSIETERGQVVTSAMPTAEGDPGESFVFAPMGITVDRVTSSVGRYRTSSGWGTPESPLASDPDNFLTSTALNGNGKLNEMLVATTSPIDVQKSIGTGINDNGEYFTVREEPIYIQKSYFDDDANSRVRVQSSDYTTQTVDGVAYVVVRGYRITLNSWTHNRYLYAKVDLHDSGTTPVTVYIAVKVSNKAPKAINPDSDRDNVPKSVATVDYTNNGKTVKSEYSVENSIATLSYYVSAGTQIIVTPYDVLYDEDIVNSRLVSYPDNGFTLNGLTGTFSANNYQYTVDANGTPGIAGEYNGINYGTSGYIDLLKDTMSHIASPRNLAYVSDNNAFAAQKAGSARIDRLFFERTTDTSNLDGYSFDPYSDADQRNSFASPTTVNGTYVSMNFGSKVKFDADTAYDMDFVVITAMTRTPAGTCAEITLNVRDRTGAGASGASTGITQIVVKVYVVNSTPHLINPNRIWKLSTTPVASSNEAVDQPVNGVIPNVRQFTATGILEDTEGETPSFVTGRTIEVYANGSTEYGGFSLLNNFVSVTVTPQEMTVTALNSSQNVKYLEIHFGATDGQSAEYSELVLRIEIVNSKPVVNVGEFETVEGDNNLFTWTVNSTSSSDMSAPRYFASGDTAASRYSVDRVKKIVTDTDRLQGVTLSPADMSNGIPSYVNCNPDDKASAKNFIPYADINRTAGSAVAVQLGETSADPDKEISDFVSSYDIEYYVDINGDGTISNDEVFSASALRADGNKVVENNYEKFFDKKGRFIVTDWAIKVVPTGAYTISEYLTLIVAMRDVSTYGGDSAGMPTGFLQGNPQTVSGFLRPTFRLFINSAGIVTYDYYDRFDGYYAVTDGEDPDNSVITTYSTSTSTNTYYYNETAKTISATRLAADDTEVVTSTRGGAIAYPTAMNEEQLDAAGAFRYSHTIDISGDTTQWTYIPMSYFALPVTFTQPSKDNTELGAVEFNPNDHFVSFDTGNNRYTITSSGRNTIFGAITVTDGTNIWSGNGNGSDILPLSDCTYIELDIFDENTSPTVTGGSKPIDQMRNGKYFNQNLAISSVDANGTTDYLVNSGNRSNLIGDDGHYIYLADQVNGLKEHTFGLGIRKSHSRANSSNLTITINVAECTIDGGQIKTNYNASDASDVSKKSAQVTFNLKIGNAPMDIVPDANGATIERSVNGYYYTTLTLENGSGVANIDLVKSGETATSATKSIFYQDGDRQDKAYFYADSAYKLSSWSKLPDGSNAYDAVKATTSGTDKYANTSLAVRNVDNVGEIQVAQNSIKNYFGGLASASVTGDYQPNGGIYGSNGGTDGAGRDGYSSYFTASVIGDGSRLSIHPIAKTFINTESVGYPNLSAYPTTTDKRNAIVAHYAKRGLVPVFPDMNSTTVSSAYYPYKVLIYDSCGDGPEEGSFVALEVRITVTNSAPKLEGSLFDSTKPENSGADKTLEFPLSVGSSYTFSLRSILTDNDLLSNDKGWFWKTEYAALVNSATTAADKFKTETGDYLVSLFSSDLGWSPTHNTELKNGTGKLTDGINVDIANQPDVVMYTEYNGTELGNTSVPTSNNIIVKVNRRMTYKNGDVIEHPTAFSYKLKFKDSAGGETGTLTVKITVTNQRPTAYSDIPTKAIEMRVGDSFEIVTTPYDYFADGSTSSTNSVSYALINGVSSVINEKRITAARDGVVWESGTALSSADRVYSQITTTALAENGSARLHDYQEGTKASHLGYVAVANDDTPWSLRIQSVDIGVRGCFTMGANDILRHEESDGSSSLSYLLKATHAYSQEIPITVTVIDGEGRDAGSCAVTFYVRIVSSKPAPVYDNGGTDKMGNLNKGLSFIKDAAGENNLNGVFELFMKADSGSNIEDESSVISVSGRPQPVTAFGNLTINIDGTSASGGVAYDPDTDDNANIGVYIPDISQNAPVFEMNGIALTQDGNRFYNDKFEINLRDANKRFNIRCKSYDSNVDYDDLTFYVRDAGNDRMENAVKITIRISTLYSSVTNKHMTEMTGAGDGRIDKNRVDIVHVKSYDTYVGNVGTDESKMGQQSVYNFLAHAGLDVSEDSIDQTDESGAYIIDPDVTANNNNLNYDVKVYAFVDPTTKTSLDINAVSNKFSTASGAEDRVANRTAGKFFLLDQDSESEYLVGGRTASGGTYDSLANPVLLAYLRTYFDFNIGLNGVSLNLRPVTANIDTDILMYIEVQKTVGTSRRIQPDESTSIFSGTLFYVKVDDSAPIANEDEDVRTFTGRYDSAADSTVNKHTFKVFDNDDPLGSLFTDSDLNDDVTIDGFDPNNPRNDYNEALADADCDWQATGSKPRAIDITIDNVAHTLTVKINRRIDKRDANGNYMSSVELPIKIKAHDRAGEESTVVLKVFIENNDFTLKNTDAVIGNFYNSVTGVGHSLEKGESDYEYTMNVSVTRDRNEYSIPMLSWIDDPDFDGAVKDLDSYRLVKNEDSGNADRFLLNTELDVNDNDSDEVIATVIPEFNPDTLHFTGVKVTAKSYLRGHTGTAYIRILDRSGNAANLSAGVTITVNITILNSAPKVNAANDNKEYQIVGKNNPAATLDPITIRIDNFVSDPNPTDAVGQAGRTDTYLRITETAVDSPRNLACTVDGNTETSIVEVMFGGDGDSYNQVLTIKPSAGFFGEQTVEIKVSDGDPSITDSMSVTFRVKIVIIYDFEEIGELNTISAMRGLTTNVTVDTLVKELENKIASEGKGGASASAYSVSQSDDGDGVQYFNPGDGYVVTKLSTTTSYGDYVKIEKNEDDGIWQFRALRTTTNGDITLTAEFKLSTLVDDPDAQVYTSSFKVSIIDNPAPTLVESFKKGYTFKQSGDGFILNQEGKVRLLPGNLFIDNDGDVMRFVSASSSAPSLVSVTFDSDEQITLQFHANGTAKITVAVADLTGDVVSHTFEVTSIDMGDPSFWQRIMISFETNKLYWIIGIAAFVLLIAILIIVIIAVKRRKRKREELEAILISEMELEEQMLRLSAASSATQLNSYGYLPPTMPVQNDPNLMLGTGGEANAPNQPPVLNLNQGTSSHNGDSGNGNPNGSGM